MFSKLILWRLAITLSMAFVPPIAEAAKPSLSIECLNPPMKRIRFTEIHSSEARSQPIMFLINSSAAQPETAINVSYEPDIEGICRVSISEGYLITRGYFFALAGISNAFDENDPAGLIRAVRIEFRQSSNRSGEFVVASSKGSPHGSAPLTFVVTYVPDP